MDEVVEIRKQNLLQLYVEFKSEQDAANPTLSGKGIDADFARKLIIAKTTLSSMKSGSRAIGPKLARQFESACGKPYGWMDERRETSAGLEEPKELTQFLKLAKRAFIRADKTEQARLRECMADSLKKPSSSK